MTFTYSNFRVWTKIIPKVLTLCYFSNAMLVYILYCLLCCLTCYTHCDNNPPDTRRRTLAHVTHIHYSAQITILAVPGSEWAGVRTFGNCPRFSEYWIGFKQMIQTQLSKFVRMWSWLGAHTFRWLCLWNPHNLNFLPIKITRDDVKHSFRVFILIPWWPVSLLLTTG